MHTAAARKWRAIARRRIAPLGRSANRSMNAGIRCFDALSLRCSRAGAIAPYQSKARVNVADDGCRHVVLGKPHQSTSPCSGVRAEETEATGLTGIALPPASSCLISSSAAASPGANAANSK